LLVPRGLFANVDRLFDPCHEEEAMHRGLLSAGRAVEIPIIWLSDLIARRAAHAHGIQSWAS
jgi:hypothetical protein